MNWKKILIALLTILLCVLIQSTLLNYITIKGVKADLALVILVFFSLYMGSNIGQLSGFFGGMVEDFLSTAPLGFYSLQKTTIGLLVGLFHGKIDQNSFLFPLLVIPLVTILKYIFSFVIVVLLQMKVAFSTFFSLNVVFEMAYNLGFGILVFLGIKIYQYARSAQVRLESND